jgi:plasmid stability protein
MATIVVRNLPDDVKDRLVERAHVHRRSMEAEVRSILEASVRLESDWLTEFWDEAAQFRDLGFEDPARDDFGRPVENFG